MRALIKRVVQGSRAQVPFTLDGRSCQAYEGDTVLTAVLAEGARVREHETSGRPHAGFCAMGACQDCWMDTATGERLRACTTPLLAGMQLLTRPQETAWQRAPGKEGTP
ncbi:(2Fe-2S)-binding protein [Ramlibacter albus]|uniref:(2Fe-2S)-binding protein n=1 Tax=Ramlibacter albus TaxID=2079448 RepID=A0A923S4Z0_9BURK|nr:(2Fe-2S)-binding protein [Ramlibacter albus]MBC5767976.1 (2Fe-2S)-binding protein [Ramlibacter albus]